MLTKIIYASSPEGLNSKMEDMSAEGWLPIGSHSVVNTHSQNRYSGSQHMDTIHKTEYSITMQKLVSKTINVDIAFYHPDDDESKKIYDEEGMREEFEYKLKNVLENQD